MESIPDVDIEIGKFKYILIKVSKLPKEQPELEGENFKFIVRGYVSANYHVHIYEKVAPTIEATGKLECDCVGGGRILHKPNEKSIDVFGYSEGYGKAKHSITCEILKKKYPDYTIKWSDEGY